MSLLKKYQWKNRVVLMFASSPEDETYRQQLEHLGNENELLERDLVVFHIFGEQGGFASERKLSEEESTELQRAFNIGQATFSVVLIGKDGTEKQRWQKPVASGELFALIDAMPMRQKEK